MTTPQKNTKYILKVNTHLVDREDDLALFSSFGNHIYLKSALINGNFEGLCNALLKPCTIDQLCQASLLKEIEVESRLKLLLSHHLIIQFEDIPVAKLEKVRKSFLSNFYEDFEIVDKYEQELSQIEINVVDLEGQSQALSSKLSLAGFKKINILNTQDLEKVEKNLSPTSFFVVIGSWSKTRSIEKFNNFFFKNQTSWLLVLIDRFGGQIGPYFSGKDSPCFSCLEKRKASFIEGGSNYSLIRKSFFSEPSTSIDSTFLPLTVEALFSLVSTEIYKIVTDLPSPRIRRGAILLDAINIKTQFNELFPVAFCETCSGFEESPLGSIQPSIRSRG